MAIRLLWSLLCVYDTTDTTSSGLAFPLDTPIKLSSVMRNRFGFQGYFIHSHRSTIG